MTGNIRGNNKELLRKNMEEDLAFMLEDMCAGLRGHPQALELSARGMDFILHSFEDSHDKKFFDAVITLIDRRNPVVTQLNTQSACGEPLSCWRVAGSGSAEYTCLWGYCPCPSYTRMAQQTVQRLLCKHLVTLRWALALGLVEEVDVSADDFVDALAGKDLVQDVTERSAFSRAVASGNFPKDGSQSQAVARSFNLH